MRRIAFATTLTLALGCADIVGLQGINDAATSDSNNGSDSSGTDAAIDAKIADGGGPPDVGGDAPLTGRKRIFYTSVAYVGTALGGIAGGDAKCAAAVAGRSLGGTFKAWLSDSQTNALDRIVEMGPWYGLDRQTEIFANKAALAYLPATPIVESDNGQAAGGVYWTGTDVGGIKTQYTCGDWGTVDAGSNAYGTYGQAGYVTSGWTNVGGTYCGSSYAVLCIEQ